MQNENTPTEGTSSAQTESESALRGAACCASLPEEVYEVDLKSWQFRRAYLKKCLTYPFYFFRAAPVSHWPRLFSSTHRMACACAVTECTLSGSTDMWHESSMRQKFRAWGRNRAEKISRENA